ncbi:DUF3857 domain-containing protein [Flavobacterium sp.]|jgi:hypothetical protein|uniref:DUF3857 domain-containing protein n=1 Tax=Flavobacterium sp. TaxID=239 RepID=UPI0037C0B940
MNKFFLFFLFFVFLTYAQKITIPEIETVFKENANSIVLNSNFTTEIKAYNLVSYQSHYQVLVLNSLGYKSLNLDQIYSKSFKIKFLKVKIYSPSGELIKELKKSDFKDNSLYDGVSVFNDNRVLTCDYTPTLYPFVIDYETEIESINTAMLKRWFPVALFNQSILESTFKIINTSGEKIQILENNFDRFTGIKETLGDSYIYKVKGIPAIRQEQLANYEKELSNVSCYLIKSSLEGFPINSTSWETFGRDYYSLFLKDNDQVTEDTKLKLAYIIKSSDNKIEKIKKIYQFLQENTRYVSVQIGIGGWKPMEVSDVEKYGYGDCKALSNYTRALLKAVGIESYCVIIFGGNLENINSDMVSVQGNHMILAVPNDDDNSYLFLECTSQTNPFGFLGDFTSNRKALLIKPSGAEIVNTSFYKPEMNLQNIETKVKVEHDLSIKGTFLKQSNYVKYESASRNNILSKEDLEKKYVNDFGYLNNLKITNIKLNNDKEHIKLDESFDFVAENYASKDPLGFILPVNLFNRTELVYSKSKNRKFGFSIDYGFIDTDKVCFQLPEGYEFKDIPNKIELDEKFGHYILEIESKNGQVLFKRYFKLNSGSYEKNDYEPFRLFYEKICRFDKMKIMIQKK